MRIGSRRLGRVMRRCEQRLLRHERPRLTNAGIPLPLLAELFEEQLEPLHICAQI